MNTCKILAAQSILLWQVESSGVWCQSVDEYQIAVRRQAPLQIVYALLTDN